MSDIAVQVLEEMLEEEKSIEIDLRVTCKCDPEKGLVCSLKQVKPVITSEKVTAAPENKAEAS